MRVLFINASLSVQSAGPVSLKNDYRTVSTDGFRRAAPATLAFGTRRELEPNHKHNRVAGNKTTAPTALTPTAAITSVYACVTDPNTNVGINIEYFI